jgi:hypothetical protein
MNLNESIIKIRVDLQNATIKKSGKNKHAGFSYFELSDFLPKLNELMKENGVNDIIQITHELASITLVKGEERETYSIPFALFPTPLTNAGKPMMQDIQYLGALNTYYKRYLYLNAFGITDGEVIDSMNVKDIAPTGLRLSLIQKDRIIKLVQEEKVNLKGVLSYYKVSSVDELNHTQAEQVIKKGTSK